MGSMSPKGGAQATFTAPGLCHTMDLCGHPHTGPVTYSRDGAAQVPLDLGSVYGREVVIYVADEEFLVRLVDEGMRAHSLLHDAHEQSRRVA